MKRLLTFSFALGIFALIFLFSSPKQNVSYAATCSQLLPGGVCVATGVRGECFRTASGASNCTSAQVCCQLDPTPTPTPNYTCDDKAGQYCSPEGCIFPDTSVAGTCPAGRRCCKTGPTPTPTKKPTPTPTPNYTCPKTTGQYCSPETCDPATEVAGSGTCPAGRRCCKTKAISPGAANCASLGGYCSPTLCSTTHPKVPGGTCSPSTYFCCNQQIIGDPGTGATKCPVCETDYYYDSLSGKCIFQRGSTSSSKAPTIDLCDERELCFAGCGCNNSSCPNQGGFTSGRLPCIDGKSCLTAIGSISTDATSLVKAFFATILFIAGGLAMLLIILSGYRFTTSQGNPEAVQNARERLTAAIVGLLFIILAFSVLRFIGVDLLSIFPR